MTDLSTNIDVARLDHGMVSVTLTAEQLAAIRNTLSWNVDLETVALDNEEPERAALVTDFIDTVDAALGL